MGKRAYKTTQRLGPKHPKGFEELASFCWLDTCVTYKPHKGKWKQLDSPHTVYIRRRGDRTGFLVYCNELWHIEMRDDGGAYMIGLADRSVLLTKVS
jgi:hypothetical protein